MRNFPFLGGDYQGRSPSRVFPSPVGPDGIECGRLDAPFRSNADNVAAFYHRVFYKPGLFLSNLGIAILLPALDRWFPSELVNRMASVPRRGGYFKVLKPVVRYIAVKVVHTFMGHDRADECVCDKPMDGRSDRFAFTPQSDLVVAMRWQPKVAHVASALPRLASPDISMIADFVYSLKAIRLSKFFHDCTLHIYGRAVS